MLTNYDTIASAYKKAKRQPWRMHIEHFSFFELLGDLSGKAVLDLACGEGFYSRFLKVRGAGQVLGVDVSAEMIRLARQEEARHPLGVDYLVQDVRHLEMSERFDLVVAAYLLNYARSRAELLAMCRVIARSLKPGGRFVSINTNPWTADQSFPGRQYGFNKAAAEGPHEGAPIAWTFYLPGAAPVEVTNYYLTPTTHEEAFRAAGLRDLCWHAPRVSPVGLMEWGREYWTSFLDNAPVILMECAK